MVEISTFELGQTPVSVAAVVDFSAKEDPRWSGVLALPAGAALPLSADVRSDLYLLSGSLLENGTEHPARTFLSRGNGHTMLAGAAGAVLFAYRDRLAIQSGGETITADDLQWFASDVPGMAVAPLSAIHHRLMLVSWRPGSRTAFHSHPRGEEIFVVDGELLDQQGRYPAGTWQRLHPGSGHAPHAAIDTLILLRNGHLTQT